MPAATERAAASSTGRRPRLAGSPTCGVRARELACAGQARARPAAILVRARLADWGRMSFIVADLLSTADARSGARSTTAGESMTCESAPRRRRARAPVPASNAKASNVPTAAIPHRRESSTSPMAPDIPKTKRRLAPNAMTVCPGQPGAPVCDRDLAASSPHPASPVKTRLSRRSRIASPRPEAIGHSPCKGVGRVGRPQSVARGQPVPCCEGQSAERSERIPHEHRT